MKPSAIVCLGVMAYLALMAENIYCRSISLKGEDGVQRILQSILTRPEYLSLDHKSQQQILIAFFHILENPIKYGAMIKTIVEKFKKEKHVTKEK
jgi:hypothetical protein